MGPEAGEFDSEAAATEVLNNMNAARAKAESTGGRRRRHSKGHKGNSWLAHVKATMKLHPGKSFKQILKIAKKTYKKSQSRSQSQSGGKRRKPQNQKSQKSQKKYQNGGSGGKMAGLGESAAPYV
jgi:hypothetical protein